jgi:hypothetical protein
MAGITYFVALPFDVADTSIIVGEPIECPSPAAAIDRAHDLWKAVAIPAQSHSAAPVIPPLAISAMRPCCENSATCRTI